MRIYDVINSETGYQEQFCSLSLAKKAMRQHNAKGYITKVYSNGDWVNCGEITLTGSNKTFVANTKATQAGY